MQMQVVGARLMAATLLWSNGYKFPCVSDTTKSPSVSVSVSFVPIFLLFLRGRGGFYVSPGIEVACFRLTTGKVNQRQGSATPQGRHTAREHVSTRHVSLSQHVSVQMQLHRRQRIHKKYTHPCSENNLLIFNFEVNISLHVLYCRSD